MPKLGKQACPANCFMGRINVICAVCLHFSKVCHSVPLPQGNYLVCARCAGAFAGAILAFPLVWFEPGLIPSWILLFVFPDWLGSVLFSHRGFNAVRIVSGFIIGPFYALKFSELIYLRFRPVIWFFNVLSCFIYICEF